MWVITVTFINVMASTTMNSGHLLVLEVVSSTLCKYNYSATISKWGVSDKIIIIFTFILSTYIFVDNNINQVKLYV